jgi:hypothetical protein
LDKLGCEAPLQTFAAPFAAFVLKNGACALMFFYRKGLHVGAKFTEGM